MNRDGQLVSSEKRAETMAAYLAEVQWAVRPTTLILDRAPIFDILPMDTTPIQSSEIIAVLKSLHWNKAAGQDEVPPELWKALLNDTKACEWLTMYCSMY